MALLTGKTKGLRGVHAVLGLLALITATGCVLYNSLWPGEAGFSHRLHIDTGLRCVDCHGVAEEPVPAQVESCLQCHQEDEPGVPRRERAVAVLERMPTRDKASDDVIFGHATHAAAGLACATCHGDLQHADTIDRSAPVQAMSDCVACHQAEQVAPNDCASCHKQVDIDVAPQAHARSWERFHGQVVRMGSQLTADNCALCHQPATCTGCHMEEPPRSHNNTFRMRTHGMVAAMDRERCDACHRPDSCIACHNEITPLSHRGSFGGKRSTHCISCHIPLQTQTCFVCHKSTPSHQMATPVPDDHSLGWNCRQCHGAGVPLPHVDDGSSCVSCHR
ncbi:MAG: hypothetical protein DRQ55_14875 [Planctomycetota bacterium]|nr:MAG: hypothetical protein DRQ55_14875 [Planctomycetota bacterium]